MFSNEKTVEVKVEGIEEPVQLSTSEFEHVEGDDTVPEDQRETMTQIVNYRGDHETDAGETIHVHLRLAVQTTRHTEPGEAQDGSDLGVEDIASIQVLDTEGIEKDQESGELVVDAEDLIGEPFNAVF
jgi:hypothetical protein